MSDDFDRLRQAMSDLSEHGGEADLYERTLRTSRRMTRRRNAAVAGAVAAAVLAVAVPVAIVDRDRPASPPIAGRPTPSPDRSATPTPDRSSTPDRTSKPPRGSISSKPLTPSTTARSSSPADGCPVTAATLTEAADLPDGFRITAASITCYLGWAEGWTKAPTDGQQGDGITLFRYDRSRAKWTEVAQGSALECADYGVPKGVRVRLPGCAD
jgi:hypothetical protein